MDIALHKYQQHALEELHTGKRCLFLPYGTGKSRIALHFSLLYLQSRTVIFCKLRNVITWQREIKKWYPELPTTAIQVVSGTKSQRVAIWCNPNYPQRILIVPYSVVLNDKDYLLAYIEKFPPERVIADESTTIKNPKAGVTKTLLKVRAALPPTTQCLILSGNPIPEHPKEIWSQANFAYGIDWLVKHNLGKSFYMFLKQWFVYGPYGPVLNIAREDQYTKLLGKMGTWLYGKALDEMRKAANIPVANYIIEEFQLQKAQKDALAELFDDWALTHEEQTDEFNYIITLYMKAQQICSGFFIQQDGSIATLVPQNKNNKIAALLDIVTQLLEEKATRKIVVWRKFIAETIMIERELQGIGCVIGPDEEALKTFMEDKNIHIIIMPVDCSQGFNELVVADTSIFFSNSYSIDSRTQAEARIERQGQQSSHVTHIDLCTNIHRDREIVTMLQAKDLTPARLKATIIKDRTKFLKQGSAAWYTPGDN